MTPASFRMRAASVPAAMASASSRYSAVTKLSPAFLAACSAASSSRAVSPRQIDLARAAFDLGQLGQRRVDRPGAPVASLPPAAVDQARGQAFLIVEQDLQKMFGGELLVAGAQRQPLRGLNEAARPLGEFLDVHICLPPAP